MYSPTTKGPIMEINFDEMTPEELEELAEWLAQENAERF